MRTLQTAVAVVVFAWCLTPVARAEQPATPTPPKLTLPPLLAQVGTLVVVLKAVQLGHAADRLKSRILPHSDYARTATTRNRR